MKRIIYPIGLSVILLFIVGGYFMTVNHTHSVNMLKLPVHKLRPLNKEDFTAGRPTVLVACGSFSPITTAHVRMMEVAHDYLGIVRPDLRVIGGFLSPVGDAYKKKDLAPAEHRIAMARLATEDSSWVAVDPWEAAQPKHQRTLVVLQHIQQAVNAHYHINNARVLLVCGADLFASFNKPLLWSDEDLQQLAGDNFGIVVVPRQGVNVQEILWENNAIWKQQRNIFIASQPIEETISSTLIRSMVKRRLSIKYLVPASVADYITQHNLYAK